MARKARVLIGDRDDTTTLRLSAKLSADGYDVVKASQISDFLDLIKENIPDAVLLGQFNDTSQPDVAKQAKDIHAPRPLPTMLFNCEHSEQFRLDAIDAEVQDMVEGVPHDSLLTRRINLLTRLSTMQKELLRRTQTAADFGVNVKAWGRDRFDGRDSQVLIICTADKNVDTLNDTLKSFNLSTDIEHDFYRAADRLDAERFDASVIVIDDEKAREQAMYLCSHLRNNPRQFNMPVIMLPSEGLIKDETDAYRAGATIVMSESTDFHLVATHCKMLVHGQRAKWSMRDPILETQTDKTCDDLHGVYSKEFFDNHLNRLISATKHSQGELTMAVFAIRNAPDVLERFGQEACDMLMQQMADWIQGLLRIEDMTARVGPYEFAVILPDTPVNLASMVANRITGILHHSEFRLTDEIMEAINVWVDLGVCAFEDDQSADAFLKRTKSSIY